MSYRDKTRKAITLPSGGKATIRRLCAKDFVGLPDIPNMAAPINPDATPILDERAFARSVHMARMALTRCCSPVTFDGGEVLSIVDKPFAECAANEISVDELDQADAQAIVSAVLEFSSATLAARDAARPFPEKPEGGS